MATQGPLYAGTVTDDSSVGAAPWSNPTNAQGSPDGSFATANSTLTTEDIVKLVIAGAVAGTNKSTGATLPTTLGFVSYGGAADLWGTTPTVAQINASNFGVVFAITNGVTHSHYLNAQNFGFSIPVGATINGILVEIDEQNNTGVSENVDAVRITITYTPAATTPNGPPPYFDSVAQPSPQFRETVPALLGFRGAAPQPAQSVPPMYFDVAAQPPWERRDAVPFVKCGQQVTNPVFPEGPKCGRVIPAWEPLREYVPIVAQQPYPSVAISTRVTIQCVFVEAPRLEYAPPVIGQPSVPAPTFPNPSRVVPAEPFPRDAVQPVLGRGTGEPKVQQFGRVFAADEYVRPVVPAIAARGTADPPTVRGGLIVQAEVRAGEFVPPVQTVGARPRNELPPRSGGQIFGAEPFPRDCVPPVVGSPAPGGPQNPPRAQPQGRVVDAEPFPREYMPPTFGRGQGDFGAVGRGLVVSADHWLRDTIPTARGSPASFVPQVVVPPTPPTIQPPYRIVAGQIFTPGAVAGNTGGQP